MVKQSTVSLGEQFAWYAAHSAHLKARRGRRWPIFDIPRGGWNWPTRESKAGHAVSCQCNTFMVFKDAHWHDMDGLCHTIEHCDA